MFWDYERQFEHDRETIDEEPWLTAREIIAGQGEHAELCVIRLAARLVDEGKLEDAVLLGRVFEAIVLLRDGEKATASKLSH